MSITRVKSLAQGIEDDETREAVLALCSEFEQIQRETVQLKQDVAYIKVHCYPK